MEGGILHSPAPQIPFTEAQEEMCFSSHGWSWQLSVLGAEVKSGARNTELWTLVGLREGNGVCLQLSCDLGGHFISLPLLSA